MHMFQLSLPLMHLFETLNEININCVQKLNRLAYFTF
jgi:hypothetical protein